MKQILYEFHASPSGGHREMNKMYRAVQSIVEPNSNIANRMTKIVSFCKNQNNFI